MAIKACLIDVSGTAFDAAGRLVPGMRELAAACRGRGIKIIFVCNLERSARAVQNAGLPYDFLLTPRETGSFKPSPKYLQWVEDKCGIQRREMICLGDSDITDAHIAAKNRILYFLAAWANPRGKYGIPLQKPRQLLRNLEDFLCKEHLWWWSLEAKDRQGRTIRKYALLNMEEKLGNINLLDIEKGTLRRELFFLAQLTASIYLSGIYGEIDFWAACPGHGAGDFLNPNTEAYLNNAALEFRQKRENVFIKTARPDAAYGFFLNPDCQRKISDKKILLIDDYVTGGKASEWARQLLYAAGAREVIFVSLGKKGESCKAFEPRSVLDPYSEPDSGGRALFDEEICRGRIDGACMRELERVLGG